LTKLSYLIIHSPAVTELVRITCVWCVR